MINEYVLYTKENTKSMMNDVTQSLCIFCATTPVCKDNIRLDVEQVEFFCLTGIEYIVYKYIFYIVLENKVDTRGSLQG